jgi:transposase
MTSLVDRLLPEELWQRIQPLLPPPPPRPRGGVPRRVPDRNCVAALIFMTRTSTPWVLLPARELGCGSATTCWRRLDQWAKAGVFDQLQALLLDELGAAGRIDLERVSVDIFSLRAVRGGSDRRQPGRSGQGRLQAACGRRPWWAADLGGGERGQRQRFDDVRGGAGRHPADPDAQRASASTAGQGPCRQGLRSSPLPGVPAPAWYPAADRPAWDRVLGAPGAAPVDDRAHRGVAWRVAAAADPL